MRSLLAFASLFHTFFHHLLTLTETLYENSDRSFPTGLSYRRLYRRSSQPVSYVDEGQVVKSWTIKDGKITSGEKEDGTPTGYYYFWSEETGYVQVPIDRTIVEELRDSKAVAAQ